MGVSLPRELGRRRSYAGGPFPKITAMTEQDFAIYRDAVIKADQERSRQAYELAAIDLGRAPCQDTQPAAFIDYCDDLNKLARVKLARLN